MQIGRLTFGVMSVTCWNGVGRAVLTVFNRDFVDVSQLTDDQGTCTLEKHLAFQVVHDVVTNKIPTNESTVWKA